MANENNLEEAKIEWVNLNNRVKELEKSLKEIKQAIASNEWQKSLDSKAKKEEQKALAQSIWSACKTASRDKKNWPWKENDFTKDEVINMANSITNIEITNNQDDDSCFHYSMYDGYYMQKLEYTIEGKAIVATSSNATRGGGLVDCSITIDDEECRTWLSLYNGDGMRNEAPPKIALLAVLFIDFGWE